MGGVASGGSGSGLGGLAHLKMLKEGGEAFVDEKAKVGACGVVCVCVCVYVCVCVCVCV